MTTDYIEFLKTKVHKAVDSGIKIKREDIHSSLFEWQKDIVEWSTRKGRCAVFLDTGLGKTRIQLQFAKLLNVKTLIIAPLSVARQTVREAKKIDMDIQYVRSQSEVVGDNKVWITNYEMIESFNASQFQAVVLDESSIIKSISSKTRIKLIEIFKDTPYRLCCTATPAPNDYIELGNHAEFLGICKMSEMLAMFFINANKEHTFEFEGVVYRKKGSNKNGTEWRLKHHAEKHFFRWLASWAITMTKPSDLNYEDNGFILPPLKIEPIYIKGDYKPQDQLFFTHLKGISDRSKVRNDTLESKLSKLKELIDSDNSQWIVWCGLDAESKASTQIISDNVYEVKGSDDIEYKIKTIEDFQDGKFKTLVSKGKIAGFGLNLQNSHNMVFFGINDSWEMFYQCIRREWRYGQKYPVNVYIIMHEVESEIYQNIMRKEAAAKRLKASLIEQIKDYEKEELAMEEKIELDYKEDIIKGENWTAMLGDSCERLKEIPDNSIDLSVYSPPFADLFTYTASERDLGNSRDWDEFFDHYKFIIQEILRVTKQGRLTCVHTSDIPAMAQKDGYIGIRDFPGEVIRAYNKEGWVFVGRAFIPKNPQALKNGTMVLTTNGYIEINNLKVGDNVIGSEGIPTKVIGVYPHELRQMYKITFSDKASIECDANHIWTVRTKSKNWFNITTKELYDNGLKTPSGIYRYEIPLVKPIELPYRETLLDPYLLGVLIGDGCLSSRSTVGMHTDGEIVDKLRLPDRCAIHMQPNTEKGNGKTGTYFITYDEWHKNPVLDALRKYQLYGLRAWEKFIPLDYLNNTIEVRKELLRGLLDTDGTIKKNNAIYYTTTSNRLAYDIRELVRSLGGLCTIKNIDNARYKCQGEERIGRRQYFMCIQIDNDYCPFKVKSKVDRWKIRSRALKRKIKNIELTEYSKCTCISVENSDGLFVVDNYIVTHNSQAIRTHSSALLFVSLRRDSSDSRPALIDQILLFKKDGENEVPVLPVKNGEIDNETWIKWANGVWDGISESDTLQFTKARGIEDEKHICPLQLGTIERCIKLYSNPKEVVLSPFMGIGSECYQAIKYGRKAIGIELKPEYFKIAVENLRKIEAESKVEDMFSMNGVKV